MKIKTLVIFLVFCVTASVLTAAPNPPNKNKIGFGVLLIYDAEDIHLPPTAALVVSPSLNTHLAMNWFIGEKTNIFNFTFDYNLLTLPIISSGKMSLGLTLGAGVFFDMEFAKDTGKGKKSKKADHEFYGGVRIPAGVSLMLGKKTVEIFAYIAPSYRVQFVPALDFSNHFFPAAVGARFWLG